MTIFIKDIASENFVRFIPRFIIKRVIDKVNENKYVVMQDYLHEHYNIGIEDVINQLMLNGFSFSKVKSSFIIRINDNIKEIRSQEKLSTLIRLIDYGNREVRGVNLINSSIDFIKSNLLNIYRIYQMRGGED